ncbi:MAG: hypothetical protein MUF68_04790, partial [Cyclobacteriaceae bacterium]|nr:hypothetical protein [Cyclobacteriaceae bacterium]
MQVIRNVVIIQILICLFLCTENLAQQNKSIKTQQQFWLGYMTSTQITERIAIWNDFHFVPKGFWVARTGLTRQWQNTSVTGGFAYLGLPLSASKFAIGFDLLTTKISFIMQGLRIYFQVQTFYINRCL